MIQKSIEVLLKLRYRLSHLLRPQGRNWYSHRVGNRIRPFVGRQLLPPRNQFIPATKESRFGDQPSNIPFNRTAIESELPTSDRVVRT